MLRFRLLMLTLVALLALVAIAPAAAQEPCPATVTVAAGDTLARIASRCGVTLDAILAANPSITNPNLVYAGQQLVIPGQVEPVQPRVAVYPPNAPPGAGVTLIASGFPADTRMLIGIGRPNAEYEVIAPAQTTARGALMAQVVVPSYFAPGQPWVIVVSTEDRTLGAVSGGISPVVTAYAASGGPGTSVELIANNFPPARDVQVSIGPAGASAPPVGSGRTDAQGALYTSVLIPVEARATDRLAITVATVDQSIAATSTPFVVGPLPPPVLPTPAPPPPGPAVAVSPSNPAPGADLLVTASGFAPGERLLLGLGRAGGEFTVTYVAPADAQGVLNVQVEIPSYAARGELWTATVQTPGGEQRAVSAPFTLAGGSVPVPPPAPTQATFTSAQIYLVALSMTGDSAATFGCGDQLVPMPVQFAPTVAPLTAALQQLLAGRTAFYGESGLYNALYQSDLQVAGINIVDGEARIALSGTLRLGGTCDAPRVAAQIEATARQFSTVNRVSVTVNGQPLASLLSGEG